MPLRDSLNRLIDRTEARLQHYQQSSGNRPPPQQQQYPQQQQQYGYPQQQYQHQQYPEQQYQQQQYPQQQYQSNQPPWYPQGPPHQQQPVQQHYDGQPPPIPSSSKPQSPPVFNTPQAPPIPPRPQWNQPVPSSSPFGDIYWSPLHQRETTIAAFFDCEEGQHGWGNNELQNYTSSPANAFFRDDGKLVVAAIVKSSAPTQQEKYTSARLLSKQRLGRTQGYIHARMTTPCAEGVWPAFWMLPEAPFKWPDDGEIDIAEDWNNLRVNHSCLHWGFHGPGPDEWKHKVVDTPIPHADGPDGVTYGFAWRLDQSATQGQLAWYIDGRCVQTVAMPQGLRPLTGWRLLLNIAMGGNVCAGKQPVDGRYETIVHEMCMGSWPPGGWQRFDDDWRRMGPR